MDSTNFMDEASRILVLPLTLSRGVKHLAMASGLPYRGGRSYENDILEFGSYLTPQPEPPQNSHFSPGRADSRRRIFACVLHNSFSSSDVSARSGQ